MFVYLLRALGVAPERAGKSGARETAWVVVIIALGLTTSAMWQGTAMVDSMEALLIFIWGFASTLLAGAYKMKSDRLKGDPEPLAVGEPYRPGDSEGLT